MKLIKKANKGKFCFKNSDVAGKLKPLFKWTGGKRREIKLFDKFFPSFVIEKKQFTYVEPFVGAGAVYWYLNNSSGKNVINDYDAQVVNFYKVFADDDKNFVNEINKISKITSHNVLEKEYYNQRNKDKIKNGGLANLSATELAIRFFIVNQLAFSGMRRFNASGEFNVPFGHYKGLNADIIDSLDHKVLLNKTTIYQGDFEKIITSNDKEDTFIFLDPPYTRIFKEYSSENSFGEEDQKRLNNVIRSLKKASIMLIIDKSTFTADLYKDMIKSSYSLKYGVNIKNRFNTAVQHLIITNY